MREFSKKVLSSKEHAIEFLASTGMYTRKASGFKAFDSVRGMFAEGSELYAGAGFKE